MAAESTPHVGTLCIALQGALALASTAQADERWGGSVAVTTDYVYRGISQTNGNPAVQAGMQWQQPGGWSASIWGSTVDFSRGGPSYEIDLRAARTFMFGPDWSAQVGVIHYEYPDDALLDYDYDELSVSMSYLQRMTASVAWSPNMSRWVDGKIARDRRALSYELTLLQPLGAHWSMFAGAGHYDLSDLYGTGYWFWNAGLSLTWETLQVDLLHIDTDATAGHLFGYSASGGRWAASLSWRF